MDSFILKSIVHEGIKRNYILSFHWKILGFFLLSLSLSLFFRCQTPEGLGNLELDANNI